MSSALGLEELVVHVGLPETDDPWREVLLWKAEKALGPKMPATSFGVR